MRGVFSSLRRNAVALGRSPKETGQEYRARLLFELRRRSRQLVSRINPFDRDQYRHEQLTGPIGVWEQLQQYQFDALTGLGLKPHHTVIDIGCGPITVGLKLISYLNPGNYVGLDARAEPLVESYRRVAKHSLVGRNPTFICSSTFGKNELEGRQFDYIWVSQLSYHLTDMQVVRLFDQAVSMMSSTSVLLIDVIDPEIELESDASWRGFSYYIRPAEFYEALARRFSMSMHHRGTILDYGYPAALSLSANRLFEFRKRAEASLSSASVEHEGARAVASA
jgi:methyltransferase family protein